MSASPTSRIPADVVALCDCERHAHERLDANAWAWVSGGAADEITLRANREAWGALRLQPRVLRDLAGGHTRVELLGRTLAHPLLLAPVAHQRLVHADGELASAHAAAAQDAGMVLSLQSSVRLEAVAAAGHDACRRLARADRAAAVRCPETLTRRSRFDVVVSSDVRPRQMRVPPRQKARFPS